MRTLSTRLFTPFQLYEKKKSIKNVSGLLTQMRNHMNFNSSVQPQEPKSLKIKQGTVVEETKCHVVFRKTHTSQALLEQE
ncbi:hypothetical protein GDO81_005625 [Engystomops pustulosus]|uniref:Uncharacterized protein n=1 Tax=Engystomops pustulosus TaxID=76066 RepID=A0AAV7CRY7_ENGPU|nr:hypothetical protein GDO81_005625 [Engystomops pustulosus]